MQKERIYSLSTDESDSDSDEDSSAEDSDIDNGSSSESSKEETSQNEYTSSRFSTKPSAKKNKWKFSKQLEKRAKAKFLKHISDQEIKENTLQNNPVPSSFLDKNSMTTCWKFYQRLRRRMKYSQIGH